MSKYSKRLCDIEQKLKALLGDDDMGAAIFLLAEQMKLTIPVADPERQKELKERAATPLTDEELNFINRHWRAFKKNSQSQEVQQLRMELKRIRQKRMGSN
jgi:hypothetical protein